MSLHSPASHAPLSLPRLREMAARGEKLSMLTAYDASFAALLSQAGVEMLLVGDSLGNVIQGQPSTLPVALEHMAYHTACVARGLAQAGGRAFLVADLPFGSYESGPQQAFESAVVLMRAGAQMVKLEGGGPIVECVRFLVDRGIPVCAHLGLTPQRVHALGGFRVQGRDEAAAAVLRADAAALAAAGAAMLVLELVPAALAREITQHNPGLVTIGIGAGAGTSAQVLVLQDMLGLTHRPAGKAPRFVRDFSRVPGSAPEAPGLGVHEAVRAYVAAVKDGSFPDETVHAF